MIVILFRIFGTPLRRKELKFKIDLNIFSFVSKKIIYPKTVGQAVLNDEKKIKILAGTSK